MIYTCIYIYIYIYTHTYIHTCTYCCICICICICISIYIYIYIHIHTHTYAYAYMFNQHSNFICVYVCVYICMYVCMYIYIYVYIYIYIYIYMYHSLAIGTTRRHSACAPAGASRLCRTAAAPAERVGQESRRSSRTGSIGHFPKNQTQRFLVCGWTAKQLSTQAEASCGPAAT